MVVFELLFRPVFFFKASTASTPLKLAALLEAISKYTTRDTAANCEEIKKLVFKPRVYQNLHKHQTSLLVDPLDYRYHSEMQWAIVNVAELGDNSATATYLRAGASHVFFILLIGTAHCNCNPSSTLKGQAKHAHIANWPRTYLDIPHWWAPMMCHSGLE